MRPVLALLGVALVAGTAPGQGVTFVPGVTGEFRGLWAAGDTLWASGRGGVYARSVDGGRSWTSGVIVGAEGLVLVDVVGFDASNACVLATRFGGDSARVYRTRDGGRTWGIVYELTHPQVFFDGMAFWDSRRGLAFSDPVDGAFLVIRTEDGCGSWTEVPSGALPAPLDREAGFAASGTAIAVAGRAHAWIGTGGGPVARVLRTEDGGLTWSVSDTPLPAGPTGGIFGVAFRDTLHGVAVGGNYQQPASPAPNVLRTSDGGRTWTLVGPTAPAGVRYGVRYAPDADLVVLATGPTGFGFSLDDGVTWSAVDTLYAYTLAAAPGRAWFAGPRGRIIRLDPVPWAMPGTGPMKDPEDRD